MRVGSLFSGIGGLDLGLERASMTVVWQSEIDPYASQVLAKHWPHVPNLGDITTIDWSTVEPVDLICGGYPCQPFSLAGVRRGESDPRHLWPFMLNAIRDLRPRFALLENVPGHLSLGFDTVLADLTSIGFDAEWSTLSACSMGAPHRRRRLYVLAYPAVDDGQGEGSHHPRSRPQGGMEPRGSRGAQGSYDHWLSEPTMDRVADGVPRSLANPPLRAVGNAVVPQVAEYIGRRIMAAAA